MKPKNVIYRILALILVLTLVFPLLSFGFYDQGNNVIYEIDWETPELFELMEQEIFLEGFDE